MGQDIISDSNHEKPAFVITWAILGHSQFAIRKTHIFFLTLPATSIFFMRWTAWTESGIFAQLLLTSIMPSAEYGNILNINHLGSQVSHFVFKSYTSSC